MGGCRGQPADHYEFWYAERWPLSTDPAAFVYRNYSLTKPSKSFEWRPRSGAPSVPWPPKGLRLTVEFAPPEGGPSGVRIFVSYEMYDDLPAYRKSVTIKNDGSHAVTVDSLIVELFRAQNFAPRRLRPWRSARTTRPCPRTSRCQPSRIHCSRRPRGSGTRTRPMISAATTRSCTCPTQRTRSSWPGIQATCASGGYRSRLGPHTGRRAELVVASRRAARFG